MQPDCLTRPESFKSRNPSPKTITGCKPVSKPVLSEMVHEGSCACREIVRGKDVDNLAIFPGVDARLLLMAEDVYIDYIEINSDESSYGLVVTGCESFNQFYEQLAASCVQRLIIEASQTMHRLFDTLAASVKSVRFQSVESVFPSVTFTRAGRP
ncbi:hypothetical protein WJX72_012421 [[Myrmecia] bisecta]|uniref:Uncharacterized protein n=1 Tax=[Myrmecia] bisecta TaxID=41462 RepID=A0AAW1QGN6_9CHLO